MSYVERGRMATLYKVIIRKRNMKENRGNYVLCIEWGRIAARVLCRVFAAQNTEKVDYIFKDTEIQKNSRK